MIFVLLKRRSRALIEESDTRSVCRKSEINHFARRREQFKRRECEWCGRSSNKRVLCVLCLSGRVHLGCKFIKARSLSCRPLALVSAFCAICVSTRQQLEELILFLWSIMRAWFRWQARSDYLCALPAIRFVNDSMDFERMESSAAGIAHIITAPKIAQPAFKSAKSAKCTQQRE